MDYEVAVIGSGSAGKEAALLAARQGRCVVVIEKETLGGTCFHRGCFPIRTLQACAHAFESRLFANRYGINLDQTRIRTTGWAEIRRRVSSALAERLSQQFQRTKRNPSIEVDQNMRTNRPSIYAIGDVNGLSVFDSTALAQAETAIKAIGSKESY